MHKFQVT